jgi:hypothetical protein
MAVISVLQVTNLLFFVCQVGKEKHIVQTFEQNNLRSTCLEKNISVVRFGSSSATEKQSPNLSTKNTQQRRATELGYEVQNPADLLFWNARHKQVRIHASRSQFNTYLRVLGRLLQCIQSENKTQWGLRVAIRSTVTLRCLAQMQFAYLINFSVY